MQQARPVALYDAGGRFLKVVPRVVGGQVRGHALGAPDGLLTEAALFVLVKLAERAPDGSSPAQFALQAVAPGGGVGGFLSHDAADGGCFPLVPGVEGAQLFAVCHAVSDDGLSRVYLRLLGPQQSPEAPQRFLASPGAGGAGSGGSYPLVGTVVAPSSPANSAAGTTSPAAPSPATDASKQEPTGDVAGSSSSSSNGPRSPPRAGAAAATVPQPPPGVWWTLVPEPLLGALAPPYVVGLPAAQAAAEARAATAAVGSVSGLPVSPSPPRPASLAVALWAGPACGWLSAAPPRPNSLFARIGVSGAGGGEVTSGAYRLSPSELFELSVLPDGDGTGDPVGAGPTLALRSGHGAYLTVRDDGSLAADKSELGVWERRWVLRSGGDPLRVALVNTVHKRPMVVTAQVPPGGPAAVTAVPARVDAAPSSLTPGAMFYLVDASQARSRYGSGNPAGRAPPAPPAAHADPERLTGPEFAGFFIASLLGADRHDLEHWRAATVARRRDERTLAAVQAATAEAAAARVAAEAALSRQAALEARALAAERDAAAARAALAASGGGGGGGGAAAGGAGTATAVAAAAAAAYGTGLGSPYFPPGSSHSSSVGSGGFVLPTAPAAAAAAVLPAADTDPVLPYARPLSAVSSADFEEPS